MITKNGVSSQDVYSLVSQVPMGKVTTYLKIALKLKIRNPRLVGIALHQNKNPKSIPCHRVVRSDGKIARGFAFGGKEAQIKKLQEEGVSFLASDKVDLQRSLFNY